MQRSILTLLVAQSLCLASPGLATLTFYESQAEWLVATQNVEVFDTSSRNIRLANEIFINPSGNSDLGSVLTFEAANTNLLRSFSLMSMNVPSQLPRGLVFDDSEAGLAGPRNISIGDADGTGDPITRSLYEDDDWQIDILSGPGLTAFGFTIIGNNESIAESLQFFSGATLIGTITDLASGAGSNARFLGVVTDEPITRIVFDEDEVDPGPDYDDIAIRDFRFAEEKVITAIETATWANIKTLFQ